MFSIGDIFSKSYKAIKFKRYFLIVDEPCQVNKTTFSYKVIDIEDGENYTFAIDHAVKDKFYPIKLEA